MFTFNYLDYWLRREYAYEDSVFNRNKGPKQKTNSNLRITHVARDLT